VSSAPATGLKIVQIVSTLAKRKWVRLGLGIFFAGWLFDQVAAIVTEMQWF